MHVLKKKFHLVNVGACL